MPPKRRRSRPLRIVLVAAVAASGLVLVPTATQALPAQEVPATQGDGGRGGPGGGGQVSVTVDVFKGRERDVVAALDDLDGNVSDQLAALEDARSAVAAAYADEQAADRAVAATKRRIDKLTMQSDKVVVGAFVNPPADSAIDVLTAKTMADVSVKSSILGLQADADASVLGRLQRAGHDLKARRAAQAKAAATARGKAADAAAALDDVEAAQSQQTAFVLEVQERLDQRLSEAEALARIDPALARQLRAEESAIAARLNAIRRDNEQRKALEALQKAQAAAEARRAAEAKAAARAAAQAAAGAGAGAGTVGAATGGLANVACPGGGSITVDGSLAPDLSKLLQAAASAGLDMCGSGYRDPAQQIALRRAHCGSSSYAIYEAPASSCSPPTARPGTSMHEQGLAIDFSCGGGIISSGSGCFDWLEGHAASFGLYNLPSEPWHWSTNGQ